MRIRCFSSTIRSFRPACILLACLLWSAGAPADTYTVYPFGGPLDMGSGTTDHDTKVTGDLMLYGGATTGTVRRGEGWFKFDVSGVSDSFLPYEVFLHVYVSDTYYPYWSITPVTSDPQAATAAGLWEDINGEASSGYYAYLNESVSYSPGWHAYALGGTAATDFANALAQDWFAVGALVRDSTSSYYLVIDGWNSTNVPYLEVNDDWVWCSGNDDCFDPLDVGTGGVFGGDTTGCTDDYTSYSCLGRAEAGADQVYAITVPGEGCTVTATLTPLDGQDAAVALGWICSTGSTVTCVAGADEFGSGQPETASYTSGAGESGTMYVYIDSYGAGSSGAYQLDVDLNCVPAPSDLACEGIIGPVQLTWTNNDVYDSINVYVDGDLAAVLAGSAESWTYDPPNYGYTCFRVCGVTGSDESCSADCCLIYGYNGVQMLWDFETDDGGFQVEGDSGWEWGVPTFGPCQAGAEGKVWATNLHGDYTNGACWILDSQAFTIESAMEGFLCFDHCYDTELEFDGTNVWFTTDDFWYYLLEPVKGYPAQNSGSTPHCPWTNGRPVFSGDSAGWVTDCWDLTDPRWHGQPLKMRFVLGSDSSDVASGWMIDNVRLLYRLQGLMDCSYTCTPASGTVPFSTRMNVAIYNLEPLRPASRFAARIDLHLANGKSYSNWRSGTTNVARYGVYTTNWTQPIPASGAVLGTNLFNLLVFDVTPPPYNQPPYAPSGDSCIDQCVLVANAP